MLVRSGFVLLFVLAGSVFAKEQRRQRTAASRSDGQEVVQDNTIGALSSLAELLESSKPKQQEQVQKNIKTYIVTKKVPVPYTVQFETRVPYPVKVPIRRPYTVYVPKPYYVEVPRPVPFAVKVPVPHPYHVEKHIAIPYKVPIDKPVPIQVAKPYPVFVEKKIPVPFEKPLPFQIKVPVHFPVERPIPVQIPVDKPLQVAVEKPVLFPVKNPVEKPISTEGTTTYEVKLKEDEPESFSSETSEYSTSVKSNDFTPSHYDSYTSSLISQGKPQKVISFLPGGTQTWRVQNQDQISYEPSTNSEQTSTWSPINSTNDWVPRYVTSVQNNLYQDPFKFVPSPQQSTIVEPNPTPVENKNSQYTLKNEVQPTYQSQIYNFVAPSDKPGIQKYQESPFSYIQHDSKKIEADGNYQFFNVHSTNQDSKSEPQISGVSFQRYETEPKSSEEPPSQWPQYSQDQSQNNFQQEQHIVQQIKKEDTIQSQSTNLIPQQAPQDFNPHNYHQYKVYYQGPNQDHFQKNHQPQYLQHDTIQQELSQNQFNNQNFPQLQQYQQQQINSLPHLLSQEYRQQNQDHHQHNQEFQQQNPDYQQQTAATTQQIHQPNGMTTYATQAQETQYLHQTVTPGESKPEGDKQYSQRRRQVQRSYQRQVPIHPIIESTNITTTEPTPRQQKKSSRRRTRKRLVTSTTETTTPSS